MACELTWIGGEDLLRRAHPDDRPDRASVWRKPEKILKPMHPGDVRDTYADISAIRRDLGFEPTTPIDEGVPRFVQWHREYHGA